MGLSRHYQRLKTLLMQTLSEEQATIIAQDQFNQKKRQKDSKTTHKLKRGLSGKPIAK